MPSRRDAETLVDELRDRFPFQVELDEDTVVPGIFYIYLMAQFGTECDLGPLPPGWRFKGWENRDQRAMLGMIEFEEMK